MSITDRLLAFSLGALTIVLIGFSVSVYWLVSAHSGQILEDRAVSTLDTLAAQCRWHPEGLEWIGDGWDIQFPQSGEAAIWGVFGASGACLETSRDLTFPISKTVESLGLETGRSEIVWMDQPWIVFRRKVVHSEPRNPVGDSGGKVLNSSLTLATAWPYRGVLETRRNLAQFLGLVSLVTWSVSLAAGRWYCKRALMPLTSMAESVRAIDVDDLSFRLPVRDSADELQSLAFAFDELMNRLEDSFARQTRFVSEASHQLRTPLAALLGQLEVALRRDRDASEYRRTLTVSLSVAQRLQKIVESLLFLARKEGSGPLVEFEFLDLTDWIPGHLLQGWSDHSRFTDIRFLSESQDSVLVRTHSAMLGQAIDNFVDNALKYGEPDTPVTIRLRIESDRAVIRVEDQGPGLDSDALENAFEPFYRSDDVRRRGIEGLGLGLAIVARLAKAIGAETGVDLLPDGGSSFRIALAAERLAKDHDEPAQTLSTGTEPNPARPQSPAGSTIS